MMECGVARKVITFGVLFDNNMTSQDRDPSSQSVNMTLDRIDRKSASVAGMAYAKLRQAILDGLLKPGEPLIEEKLAADLDISRTPLREALARLEHDGLIVSVPYRGTVVISTTLSEVMQTMQIRERLEILAIELAIESMPAEEIIRVRDLITEQMPHLLVGDLRTHFVCNHEFHGLAPRFSGNRILEQMILTLEEKAHIFRLQVPKHAGTLAEVAASADEHLAILEAYLQGELDGAIALMNQHLRVTRERLDWQGA